MSTPSEVAQIRALRFSCPIFLSASRLYQNRAVKRWRAATYSTDFVRNLMLTRNTSNLTAGTCSGGGVLIRQAATIILVRIESWRDSEAFRAIWPQTISLQLHCDLYSPVSDNRMVHVLTLPKSANSSNSISDRVVVLAVSFGMCSCVTT